MQLILSVDLTDNCNSFLIYEYHHMFLKSLFRGMDGPTHCLYFHNNDTLGIDLRVCCWGTVGVWFLGVACAYHPGPGGWRPWPEVPREYC